MRDPTRYLDANGEVRQAEPASTAVNRRFPINGIAPLRRAL